MEIEKVMVSMKFTVSKHRSAVGGQSASVVCRPSSAVCRLSLGFTLVELMVVIVVISILVGITLSISKYAVRRAKEAKQEVMLAKIRSALDGYRAAYGEYPITPNTNGLDNIAEAKKHYWDGLTTNKYSIMNNWLNKFSPISNINLSSNAVETLQLGGSSFQVDCSLTFPLMIRPMLEGKRPFYKFDDITVASLVYRRPKDNSDYYEEQYYRRGGMGKLLKGIRGQPVNRPEARDPVSGLQWKYVSSNGVSYTLTTNLY